MIYDAIVRNIAIIGETKVEKKRIIARRAKSLSSIPTTAGKRSTSSTNHLKSRSPIRRNV
jgi:hypothetical protein